MSYHAKERQRHRTQPYTSPENLIPQILAYIFRMTLCHATNIFCLLLQSAYIYDTATYPHNPKDRKNS